MDLPFPKLTAYSADPSGGVRVPLPLPGHRRHAWSRLGGLMQGHKCLLFPVQNFIAVRACPPGLCLGTGGIGIVDL